MKLLKVLKKGLKKVKLGPNKTNTKVKNRRSIVLINKATRDDDDLFLFI
ncbi:hypothetical protein [Algibacter pacificus]|nr:hypothetical protein [Algibacter pacificus]